MAEWAGQFCRSWRLSRKAPSRYDRYSLHLRNCRGLVSTTEFKMRFRKSALAKSWATKGLRLHYSHQQAHPYREAEQYPFSQATRSCGADPSSSLLPACQPKLPIASAIRSLPKSLSEVDRVALSRANSGCPQINAVSRIHLDGQPYGTLLGSCRISSPWLATRLTAFSLLGDGLRVSDVRRYKMKTCT